MSKNYPKGTPKSSIRLVVLHTSIVLFIEHTSNGSRYVRTTDSNVCLPDLAYVHLLRASV
jgi:hypothetical protein